MKTNFYFLFAFACFDYSIWKIKQTKVKENRNLSSFQFSTINQSVTEIWLNKALLVLFEFIAYMQ